MATTLGSIIVELLARTGSFDTDIARSTKAAEKRMKEMQDKINAGAASLGAKLGTVLGGAVLVAKIKSTIDGLDALNDVADATGASIENISALEDAGIRAGNSFESVTTALVKFNAELKDTSPDNKTADILKRIGLNADELRKMDPAQALHEVAKALAQFRDDGDKARVVQELFGKTIREVAPLLKDLAEKTELTSTVNTQAAKDAEAFNKSLAQMGKNSTDAARAILKDLIPAVNSLMEKAKDQGFFAMFGFDKDFFDTKALAAKAQDLKKQLEELNRLKREFIKGNATQEQVDAQQALFNAAKLAFRSADAARVPSRDNALFNEMNANEAARLAGRTARSIGPLPAKATGPKGPDPDADFKSYLNNLQQQIQKVEELTAVEKLEDDVRRGHLTLSKAQKEELLDLAKIVDKRKELAEQMKAGREQAIAEGDAVQEANKAYQERLKALLDATPMAQTEKLRQDLQLLQDEFNMQGSELSKNPEKFQQAWKAAVDAASKPLDHFTLQLSDTQEAALAMGQAGLEALRGMALEGDSLNDVLGNVLKSFANMIFQIGVMEPAMKALREAMGGGVTPPNPFKSNFDLGGLITSGIGSLFGGGFSLPFGGGRASGGDVLPGFEYDVGELGRERFRPRTVGTIFPAGSTGQADMPMKIINNTTGRVDKASWNPREKAILLQEVSQMVAAQAGDPSSALQQSLQRSSNVRPRRF